MDIGIYLDTSSKRIRNYVNMTIEIMNAHQNEFHLIDMRNTLVNHQLSEYIINSVSRVNAISFEKVKHNIKQLDISEKSIIITDRMFDDNWFSHSTSDCCFMTVSDWDDHYAPPQMDKFIQYEIIQFFAICAARLSDTQIRQVYNSHFLITDDCLFDFCKRKTDIKISMRSGRICPVCKIKLSDYGVTEKQFQALSILLKLMTGKATFDKVFIVHGHGEYKESVARFIENMGITPIILSEQVSRSDTIIEKFEKASSKADFAIILYTPDDIGGVIGSSYDKLKPRARQNVVFEHGFFTAKLGRENVVVLLKNDTEKTKLETAGDNDGIIYVLFDDYGGWKEHIVKAMQLSGYRVNPRNRGR